MAQRVYKPAAIYDSRIVGMRNLWEPSTEYMGRPTQKPNYLVTVIMRKTRGAWYEEPALADFAKSCNDLYTAAMSHVPFPQVEWPVKDGDLPDNTGKVSAWKAGHWVLNGSSSSPIEVSINQGGVTIPLKNRADVKSGDHVMVATSVAVNSINPRAVKVYINKVVFMAPGEEIVLGTSVSTSELMDKAKAQGLNVTGYGGTGAPAQGFGFQGPSQSPGGPVGFGQGFAPPMGNPVAGPMAPPAGFAPPPVQPPAQQPSFAAPTGFGAPQGFPPRQ